MMVSDTVLTTLITSLTTMITVLVTGWFNRKTTRDEATEIHNKIDATTAARTTDEVAIVSAGEGDRAVVLPVQPEVK